MYTPLRLLTGTSAATDADVFADYPYYNAGYILGIISDIFHTSAANVDPLCGPIYINSILSYSNTNILPLLICFSHITHILSRPSSHMFRGTVTYRICHNVYDPVHSMVEQYLGRSGSPFLPHMLFIFYSISLSNVSGLVPGVYAVTSNLSVTFHLSMVSWLAILSIGSYTNRLHLSPLFMPPKIPFVLTPFLLIIETLSYTTRIASLSSRLFANIVAGHILSDCFTMFVYLAPSRIDFETLSYAIITGFIIPYSSIFLSISESMVASLQAYIFTVPTSIYPRDSIHISH